MRILISITIVLLLSACSKDMKVETHGDPGGQPAPGCVQFDDQLNGCNRCVEMVLKLNNFNGARMTDTVRGYEQCLGVLKHGDWWRKTGVFIDENGTKVYYEHYIDCYNTIYNSPSNNPRFCYGDDDLWNNIPTGYKRCVRTAQSNLDGKIDSSDKLIWGDGWKEISHESAVVGDSTIRWFCYDKIP